MFDFFLLLLVNIFCRKVVKKGTWTEEETEQLRALFDEYKSTEGGGLENIFEIGRAHV